MGIYGQERRAGALDGGLAIDWAGVWGLDRGLELLDGELEFWMEGSGSEFEARAEGLRWC